MIKLLGHPEKKHVSFYIIDHLFGHAIRMDDHRLTKQIFESKYLAKWFTHTLNDLKEANIKTTNMTGRYFLLKFIK